MPPSADLAGSMLHAALSRIVLRTHRARLWVPALAALALTVCGEPPSGPASGAERAVRLAFQPTFQQMDRALFQVASSGIDNVHLVLRDAVGTVVLDTIVAFPAGQDSVAIAATVLVRGESERFAVKFELRAGTQTMFEGTQDFVARPGVNTPTPTTVPLVFVGPGARAARVTVAPASTTLQAGSTIRLSAEVADASGAPITDALLVWTSSNESSASVSASGVVTALNTRGTAIISATTLSGIAGSASVFVTLPASRVMVTSGDGQTGTAGAALAQPFAVQVLASDGVGVGGVSVAFSASASGATVSPVSATTDAQGHASTSMKLGKLAGAQVFTATVTGLNPTSVNATATRGDATVITIVSGDAQVDTAGRTLRQPLVVRVTDTNGNAASGVGVTWSRVSGSGTLSAATSTTDAQGQTQATYTLGNGSGTDVVRAAITAQPASGVDFTLTTRPRAPSRVVVVSGDDQSGTVGTTASQPLVVRATDETGQAVPGVDIIWNRTNGAVLSASTSTTDATGQSSVNVTYPTQPGTFSVSAQLATLSGASVGFSLSATAGPAAALNVTAGAGQSASGDATLPVAPAVLVTDRYGNLLAGVSVVFVAGNGGSVTGSPATTNASGVATLGSWTLGPTAGTQTLTVSAGAVSTTILATATVVATPPVLSVMQQPSASVANTQPFAMPPRVQLKTGAGVALKTAGIVVTVALKTTGPTLRGTLTATTDTAGVATFNGLSLRGIRGNHVLMFTAPGYLSDTSKTFALTAGPAIGMFASSATTLSGVTGSVAAPTPKVLVTDSTDNPVGGVNVTFAVTDTAHGTVTGGATVTDTTGYASPGSWTLGRAVRKDTLSATAAGLVGSPVQFVATTTVGAATQLVSISGDAQTGVTGNPLASPMVVEARDAFNNPVAGVAIGFATLAGGSPATASVTTDAAGRAAFTLTLGAPGADTVKACLPSCATAQVFFGALSVPVGADAIWVGATSASWATAGNWSPAVVPGALNKVFIPAGRPFNPALSGNVSVSDLTLASGATLDVGVSQMALGGALLATGATMTGSTGYIYFCGGTHSYAGASFSMITDCGATVSPAGTSTIAGGLTVQGGSVFDVGTSNVSVTGNVGMYGGARIKMIAAGGHLTVNGNYDSNPGNDVGDTWMTDGVLELKGNLQATNGCCGQGFRAVGNHVTRFSGSGAQSISFAYAHEGYHRETFGHMEFTGGNTVTLVNNIRVFSTVSVTGTTKVVGSGKVIYHGGQLTTAAGTDLSGLSYTQLNGGGAVFPLIAGVGPGEVQIAGSMTVSLPAAAVTMPTHLTTHSGAVLDLEGRALTVTGNFGMYSGSRMKMVQPAAHFTVHGVYDSNPGNDVGDAWMTDGVLELKGNLQTTNGCCGQGFRAVGSHVTRFSGSTPQSISLVYAHEGYHRETFGRLEFTGGNTVTLANNVRVHNTVSVTGTTKVVGSGKVIYHGGQLTAAIGTDLSGLSYTQLNGGGAVFPLIAGVGPGEVQIAGAMTVSLPQAVVTLPTHLTTHSGAVLNLEGKSLTVTGNFGMYSGSRVAMQDPAAHFTVVGLYDSNPGNDVGDAWMTAGVLELKGNLQATNGCCGQGFRAVGSHITRFSGTGAQAVSFVYSHEGYHRETFGHLEFTGNNTVTLANSIRVHNTVSVTGTTKVVGSGKVIYHLGQLTAAAGTDLSGLSYTQLNAGGAVFPLIAGAGPGEVQIAGNMTVSLPASPVTVPTNLTTHSSAALNLEGKSLTVTGNFGMYSGSRVAMQDPAAHFTVTGLYDSNPGNDVGDAWMTAGVLELKGNIQTTNACCGQGFRAVGSHITRFSGSGPQTVSFVFSHESYGRESFGHVEFTGDNTVTLANSIRVHNTVSVTGTTKVMGSGKVIYHGGQLTAAAGTDLSGLSYTQLNGGGAVLPLISGVGPGEVQIVGGMTVSLPSASVTVPSSLTIHSGAVLDLEDKSLTATGNFGMYSGSRVKMVQAATLFTVNGNYDSNPTNDIGDTWFTNGILDIKGSFTATNGCCGQSFRAVGSHLTRFSGTGAQNITVAYPTSGQTAFQNVEVTNASASGVATGSSLYLLGGLTNSGRFTVNTGHTVTVQGAVTLGASSITTNAGAFSKGSCSAAAGATLTGFSCP